MVMATSADQDEVGSRCLALVGGCHQDTTTHPFRRTGGKRRIRRRAFRPLPSPLTGKEGIPAGETAPSPHDSGRLRRT